MRRLWFLYLALMVALLSGCATTAPQSGVAGDQLKNLGEKALLAHDAATSLRYLTEAEHKQPHDASIEYDLALAYNQRGFKAQALEHIKMALKIKPDYPEALNTIGYIYATNGQFDPARAAFEKAMNDPFYQTPQIAAFNLGRLYEERGDYTNALPYYRQAVKLHPDYAQAWLRIGRILERTGKNEEARLAYEKALRESSDLAEAHLRLGIMSYRAGDFKEAAGSFGQVERIAPNSELATEAQKYLEKLNNRKPALRPFHYRSSRLKIEKPEGASASAQSANASAPITAAGNDNGAHQANTTTVNEPSPWRYIVSIGSYTGRAKAEELKSSLREKGYKAVVRHARGRTFVVELQPVDTFSQASTLMAQIAAETHHSPKAIRIRAR